MKYMARCYFIWVRCDMVALDPELRTVGPLAQRRVHLLIQSYLLLTTWYSSCADVFFQYGSIKKRLSSPQYLGTKLDKFGPPSFYRANVRPARTRRARVVRKSTILSIQRDPNLKNAIFLISVHRLQQGAPSREYSLPSSQYYRYLYPHRTS
jgi:hypothetical protein